MTAPAAWATWIETMVGVKWEFAAVDVDRGADFD